MGNKDNEKSAKNSRIVILIFLLITITAVCVTIWAVFSRDAAPELAPDYAPQQTEENAETIPDDNGEKLESSDGGGAVSLTYSDQVSIDLNEKTVALLFANPNKSNQDMVLQIVVQDEVIVQTGTLKPGNQLKKLDLPERAAEQLSPGGYDGKFVVLYYDPTTAEKAIVNTEIPIRIAVNE